MEAKRFILHTLVMSKFMATSSSWILSTSAEKKCCQRNVMRIYRYLFFAQPNIERDRPYSHDYVIHYLGVLEPDELLHIHRLRALISMVKTAPPYVWVLLNKDGEWLSEVSQCVRWLNDHFPLPANEITSSTCKP